MAKAFVHFKRQHYANLKPFLGKPDSKTDDQIMIQDYSKDGCNGEFAIEWKNYGDFKAVRLSMYDEAWKFFGEFSELFYRLSLMKEDITPLEFSKMLISIGFKDRSDISLEEYEGDKNG